MNLNQGAHMTPSKKLKPFMTYIDDTDYVKLKRFAKKQRITMAQVLREGLNIRMSEGDPYITGFNDGLNKASTVITEHNAGQMRFPSGQSFADILCDEVSKHIMREVA
jgi:hypothetical protein